MNRSVAGSVPAVVLGYIYIHLDIIYPDGAKSVPAVVLGLENFKMEPRSPA